MWKQKFAHRAKSGKSFEYYILSSSRGLWCSIKPLLTQMLFLGMRGTTLSFKALINFFVAFSADSHSARTKFTNFVTATAVGEHLATDWSQNAYVTSQFCYQATKLKIFMKLGILPYSYKGSDVISLLLQLLHRYSARRQSTAHWRTRSASMNLLSNACAHRPFRQREKNLLYINIYLLQVDLHWADFMAGRVQDRRRRIRIGSYRRREPGFGSVLRTPAVRRAPSPVRRRDNAYERFRYRRRRAWLWRPAVPPPSSTPPPRHPITAQAERPLVRASHTRHGLNVKVETSRSSDVRRPPLTSLQIKLLQPIYDRCYWPRRGQLIVQRCHSLKMKKSHTNVALPRVRSVGPTDLQRCRVPYRR